MNKKPKYQHLTQYKWVKGQSGNLQGRPKAVSTILKEMGYTRPAIAAMVAEIMFMNFDDMREIADSRTEPMIKVIIASTIWRAKHHPKDLIYFLNILFEFSIPQPGISPLKQNKSE